MHPTAISGYRKRPEVSLVGAGAGADVTGGGIQTVTAAERQQVLAAAPRLNFKKAFADYLRRRRPRRHPRGAGRTFMRDIAERHVAGYKASNICDAIDASPF